ncbi:MAG: hypothetical protein ACREMA_01170, partial [Longimicrobiales bacterium]
MLCLFASNAPLLAQQDTVFPARTSVLTGRVLEFLPIDHVQALLAFRAGTFPLTGAEGFTRGSPLGVTALYLDGVPLLGALFGRNTLAPPVAGVGQAELPAFPSAALGNTRGGAL